MTTKQITPRDLELKAALKLAQELDLPSDLHEGIMVLRKQTPLVRYIRMAAIVDNFLNHLKKMSPTDMDIQFVYTNHIVDTKKNIKRYVMTGDIKGLNDMNKRVEDELIEIFNELPE